MTIGDLLQLNPQHLDELRSFFEGFEFDDIEIVAQETVAHSFEFESCGFATAAKKLRLDGVFRGKTHTHFIFIGDVPVDNVFYCFSYARVGECEERIIFKLIRHDGVKS